MRGAQVALVAAVALSGCTSLTDVEVGAGQVPVVDLDVRFPTVSPGPPASASRQIEFLSQADAASFAQQLGSAVDAIDRIDVQPMTMVVTPLAGAATAHVTLGLTPLDAGRRVPLDPVTQQQVMDALHRQEALDVTVALTVDGDTPSEARVQGAVQPILVVQALETL